MDEASGGSPHEWTFLSNHACVLTLLAGEPELRIRDIAPRVGLTERTTHEILRQLAEAGFLVVTKRGRRNHYEVMADRPLRHPLHRSHRIGELIAALTDERGSLASRGAEEAPPDVSQG